MKAVDVRVGEHVCSLNTLLRMSLIIWTPL